MKKIGITGGVGAGKTSIIEYIREKYNACVVVADKVAHHLEEKGQPCYNDLVENFGIEILDEEQNIDAKKFAEVIFSDEQSRRRANEIIHPAVKKYILEEMERQEKLGTYVFVVEAALLLEDGYDEILDDIWYVYAGEETRRKRLKESRGYSEEKINRIMASQMSEDEYRLNCKTIINNDKDVLTARKQIDELLGEVK